MAAEKPTMVDFMRKFTLENLQKWALAPKLGNYTGAEYCQVSQTAPTVGMLVDAYGFEDTAAFLTMHINAFIRQWGLPADRKPTESQLTVTALSWLSVYPHLKVTELWVFFFDIMAGKYGQLAYGTFELQSLGACLNVHLKNRLELQRTIDARKEFERQLKLLNSAETH